MTPTRYAIYFIPDQAEPWAAFCTAWLGWDIAAGKAVEHPDIAGLDRPVSAITAVPRRYGLHATLKPPFRLRAGKTAAALTRAVRDLARDIAPVTLSGLDVTPLGRFLALTAQGETRTLNAAAARIVRELDAFRAPPSDQELERRRSAHLSPAQEANLKQWGYPHVLDQFRFHMTLTSKLPKDDQARTLATLQSHLAPLLPRPFVIRDIALVGEDDEGFFHLIDRFALSGA
ncbi:DUF1045 domain-containing protein [Aestuariivita boseongensis]|uniref:DUF1045 domain-containing protein n=1 Tax=Aestuariivita boseongensis TaxID=1470562 RepID=UPI000682B60B|nr:DUF1045 domain-containing protein [Aestuariivita boseongensis]